MEYYLSHPDRNVRFILTKFTLSEHKLLIEIGRNLKIPRDQRLCAICNVLEDEFHFSSECKRNTNNRNILYQYFQNIYSNFLELNHEKKLIKILKPSTTEQIRTVTSFIKQSLEWREGELSVIIAVQVIVFFLCSNVYKPLFVLSVHVYYVNCNAKTQMGYLCALIKYIPSLEAPTELRKTSHMHRNRLVEVALKSHEHLGTSQGQHKRLNLLVC